MSILVIFVYVYIYTYYCCSYIPRQLMSIHVCLHVHPHESVCLAVCLHLVKPLQPATSTDRPLRYIDRFISVPNDRPCRYYNSLNGPPSLINHLKSVPSSVDLERFHCIHIQITLVKHTVLSRILDKLLEI